MVLPSPENFFMSSHLPVFPSTKPSRGGSSPLPPLRVSYSYLLDSHPSTSFPKPETQTARPGMSLSNAKYQETHLLSFTSMYTSKHDGSNSCYTIMLELCFNFITSKWGFFESKNFPRQLRSFGVKTYLQTSFNWCRLARDWAYTKRFLFLVIIYWCKYRNNSLLLPHHYLPT